MGGNEKKENDPRCYDRYVPQVAVSPRGED